METKLVRIAQIAKERPKEQFTSLAYLLNADMLLKCHQELSRNKAPGIDEVNKTEYEKNLLENIRTLHESLKKMTYKPQAKGAYTFLKQAAARNDLWVYRPMRTELLALFIF